jgi:hypothetical protein
MSFTQTIGEKMANIPYNYRLGLIEATNYVLENYQIKFLGKCVLFKHQKDGSHEEIGHWAGSSLVLNSTHELDDKENLNLSSVCLTTTKRIENDINGTSI